MSYHVGYGYTMSELHRIACQAVRSCGPMGSDWQGRYEAAWHAIAEELYSAWEAPSERDLIMVGRTAVYADVRAHRRDRGYLSHNYDKGAYSSPQFWRYWWPMTWSVPSHEDKLIDRISLVQIIWTLTPLRREALIALAVWDRYDLAAMALGISEHAFVIRLNRARADFRKLWHQGETPSRMWGSDQRVNNARQRREVDHIIVRDVRTRRKRATRTGT